MSCILEKFKRGGIKELDKVSWNGGTAKYDLRDLNTEQEKMGKGVTLTGEEAKSLYEILKGIFE